MPRPRKPTAVKELTGAYKRNPNRRPKDEPSSNGPLGEPPNNMTEAHRAIWAELQTIIPPRVAQRSDRIAFELLTRLLWKARAEAITGAELSQLVSLLARMGLTPADRSKVSVMQDDDKPSAFDEFKLN